MSNRTEILGKIVRTFLDEKDIESITVLKFKNVNDLKSGYSVNVVFRGKDFFQVTSWLSDYEIDLAKYDVAERIIEGIKRNIEQMLALNHG